jgi:hypothetical protein
VKEVLKEMKGPVAPRGSTATTDTQAMILVAVFANIPLPVVGVEVSEDAKRRRAVVEITGVAVGRRTAAGVDAPAIVIRCFLEGVLASQSREAMGRRGG